MKQFKDFGIKPSEQNMVGDKIKILKILNKEIAVHGYYIKKSKFHDGDCLYMQISMGETKYVVFVGSASLIEMINQVPKDAFPFTTTITRPNERYEFS